MNRLQTPIRINKFHESLTGIFFIAASASAIAGLLLYDPLLHHSDDLAYIKAHAQQVSLGALFELVLCFSNIGTAIMLYPVLRYHHKSWSLGYVCFRLMEVVFIAIGILSLLTQLSLNSNLNPGEIGDMSNLMNASSVLRTIHRWTFVLGPHFMLGINTLIYSMIFYQSRFIPRSLATYGITGAVLIMIAGISEIFNMFGPFSTQIALMAIPIATFEMTLAFRLILKGYNPIDRKQVLIS